ncbi:MAG: hypothetical protein V5A57_00290 [Candidatus Paceibacterota bacterium]
MYKPYQDQENQKTGDYKPRGPLSDEDKYDSGKEDYIICPDCNSVYEGKGWHHHSEFDIERLKKEEEVRFEQCPACKMIEDKYFQGEIIIENPPANQKEQIKNTAQNYGEKAFKKDPLDRVISIGEKKVERPTAQEKRGKESRDEVKGRTDIRILTTENQLAVRIAKKVNESLGRKADLDIKHSHRDKVSRVRVKFPEDE